MPAQVAFSRRLMVNNGDIWMLVNPNGPIVPWSDTFGVYVATKADYERDLGMDYEAGLTGNSLDNEHALPLDARTEGIIRKGIARLLNDLKKH